MIFETFKSRRKPAPVKEFTPPKQIVPPTPALLQPPNTRPNESDRHRARQFKITPEEFVRRDKIVRQLYLDTGVQWAVGEVCRPLMDQEFEEYGRLEIVGIYKTFHEFSTAEAFDWPDDDKPLIFTVRPEKRDEKVQMLCVNGKFLKKLSAEEKNVAAS